MPFKLNHSVRIPSEISLFLSGSDFQSWNTKRTKGASAKRAAFSQSTDLVLVRQPHDSTRSRLASGRIPTRFLPTTQQATDTLPVRSLASNGRSISRAISTDWLIKVNGFASWLKWYGWIGIARLGIPTVQALIQKSTTRNFKCNA